MKLSPAMAKRLGVSSSPLERKFLNLWKLEGGPELTAEFKFHPKRKWRFDFAYLRKNFPTMFPMVAIELEGGIWRKSRHTTGSGFSADAVKYFEAQLLGWRVYRLTSEMITPANIAAIIQTL